jgi:predicted TIM-barrel fold metal-dependent hydrolase
MSGPLTIDVHMHLYETKQSGEWWKAGYEIWEYGEKEGVEFGRFSGDVDDAVTALTEAGYAHGVAVNLFGRDLFRLEAIDTLPAELVGTERDAAIAQIEASLPDRMCGYNGWLVDAVAAIPQITPFVAVDPWVLSPEENVAHLREMAGSGARGIKLHPVVQRFEPNDPRMHSIYGACREMNLVVLSHTGSAKGGERFAEPAAFADVLRSFPELRVVLAHVGGGAWRQTLDLANAFPQVSFDLCEIIEWTGAPNAPTAEELARMITEIGPDRVMLGTDFPWYDLARTAQQVTDLPVLSPGQKEAILGENAARLLDVPV